MVTVGRVLRQLQWGGKADCSLAQLQLGFVPTPLTTALRSILNFFRQKGFLDTPSVSIGLGEGGRERRDLDTGP